MYRYVTSNGREIPYVLRKSRRGKHIRITVHCNGLCSVTIPRGVPTYYALLFLKRNIQWVLQKTERFLLPGFRILPPSEERKHYKRYREEVAFLIERRAAYFNALYGFTFAGITVKNQKTVWGSCSRKGNLNFNYRILFLPEAVRDYVIVHELCHLKEFNHSPAFWNLVALASPDYRVLRANLRKIPFPLVSGAN